MTITDKKAIQQHLLEAITREDLTNREAAKYLNLHPMYISQLKNEKYWDNIPASKWNRFEEWHNSRLPLKDFVYTEETDPYFTHVPSTPPEEKPVKDSREYMKEYHKRNREKEKAYRKARKEKLLKESSPSDPIIAKPDGIIELPPVSDKELAELKDKFRVFYEFMTKAERDIALLRAELNIAREEYGRMSNDVATGVQKIITGFEEITADYDNLKRYIKDRGGRQRTVIIFQKNVYQNQK